MSRKTEKGGKFRNVHCRTWNMARKLKIMENSSLIHLDLSFVQGDKNGSIQILLHTKLKLCQHQMLKMLSFFFNFLLDIFLVYISNARN